MKMLGYYMLCLGSFFSCARQPGAPGQRTFNVTASHNDSIWYGTGKVLRLREKQQEPTEVKKFNLLVFTDIDYPGMGGGPNPNTETGCIDTSCTRTQSLAIYNIPLRKGRRSIAKLNKQAQPPFEQALHSYIFNSGGLAKRYNYQNRKPGWIRVKGFDKATGIVWGSFGITFSEDKTLTYESPKELPPVSRFTNGQFRIKLTDVLLR